MDRVYISEPIIQLIQSLLTGKQAAQTTLLSKSWGSAWLTQPDLSFDERDHSGFKSFSRVVNKCLKRYEESNLKIKSFDLRMWSLEEKASAKQFIAKALELGATRLTIGMFDGSYGFVIPDVVFESENLVELTVIGCKIRDVFPSGSIRCIRLKSLSLEGTMVKSNVVAHIISHCQFIEKLLLTDKSQQLEEKGAATVHKMQNLRNMVISQEKLKDLFLGDVSSSKLPALKCLALEEFFQESEEDKPITIYNQSVVHLSLTTLYPFRAFSLKVDFDVPKLREFTYRGSVKPSLTFKFTQREPKCRIFIDCCTIHMFYGLHEFLTRLKSSAIDLHLDFNDHSRLAEDLRGTASEDDKGKDVDDLPKLEVQNITMDFTELPTASTCFAILDGLFKICKPKQFTQYFCRPGSVNRMLCKMIVQQLTGRRTSHLELVGLKNDLKGATLHVWNEIKYEWREVSLDYMLNAPFPTRRQKIQFRLGWK